MLKVLEKLTARKSEMRKAKQGTWAQLVGSVVDERLKDSDKILKALDELNRTPEELQTACELLIQRRAWAAELAAGRQAEKDHPNHSAAIDAENEAFKRAQAEHEARLCPLIGRRDAGVRLISAGETARRQLLETVSDEAQELATADIDARFKEFEAVNAEVQKRHRDREDWIINVESLGESAPSSDIERLPSARAGLTDLRKELDDFAARFEALNAERTAALEALLIPEVF